MKSSSAFSLLLSSILCPLATANPLPLLNERAPSDALPRSATPNPAPRAGPGNLNVVYYAQSPATPQVPLTTVCADPNIDVVVLAFITDFYHAGGYPTLNLASKCWAPNEAQKAANATGLIDCVGDGFATQVAGCQKAGKKVLLSVGGAIANNDLPSADAAVKAAKDIWGLFLGGSDPKLAPLRPFGPNVTLDGIDIDNQTPAWKTYIPDLVRALRGEFATDPSKKYFLSAAPQCPRPDQSIPIPELIPYLDYVYVQFYNNPSCNINAGSGFIDSLRAWSQDLLNVSGTPAVPGPAPSTTDDDWSDASDACDTPAPPAGSASSTGPQLFIGIIAGDVGSGYVKPSELKTILEKVKPLNLPNLAGVGYWDGAYVELSGANGTKNFAQVVKETLP